MKKDITDEIQTLKQEIQKLKTEAQKYKTEAQSAFEEKQNTEVELNKLKDEYVKQQKENRLAKSQALLDKAGCIKSDLVAGIIPDGCEDVEVWIDNYKKDNEILFKRENHGGNYKPSAVNNITPSAMMNNFIRNAAHRGS